MTHELVETVLGWTIVGVPALLVAVLGLASLVHRPLQERTISRLVLVTNAAGLLAAIGLLGTMVYQKTSHVEIQLGNWIVVPHYHFSVKLLIDQLSLPFVMLSFVLCGTIGAFANRYLHREAGYSRFFMLYALFVLGMVTTGLAGTIETLFFGWELVGLSSALLVAYFQERTAPVRNGLRVWTVYRISDAALLVASIALHHLSGGGDFAGLLGAGTWPDGHAAISANQALVIGLLLLLAAAGKSALVPFSGWLPRAMEGPTPSSAVFYGALSVHLGAYLLLRVAPLLELSALLCALIVTLGLTTACFGAIAARAQTDIKSALSFASLTQVGLIVAEIGLGLRWIALAHLIGHACLRTLQFLRAPTLLQDYRMVENAIRKQLPRSTGLGERVTTAIGGVWLYRLAIERGYLDAFLNDYIAGPFLSVFRWCDSIERRWTDWLSGQQSRESDNLPAMPDLIEELS